MKWKALIYCALSVASLSATSIALQFINLSALPLGVLFIIGIVLAIIAFGEV